MDQEVTIDVPPTYGSVSRTSKKSLFSELKKTKEDSSTNAEFAQNAYALVCTAVCGSVIGLVCLGIAMAIPIAMIVLGAIYLNDCPAEDYIPIYLIVAGSFFVFTFVVSLCVCIKQPMSNEELDEENGLSCFVLVAVLLFCFILAWFIAGNVWVYRTHGDWSEDPTASNYCNPTLYWFSFWLFTSFYIFVAIITMIICAKAGVSLPC